MKQSAIRCRQSSCFPAFLIRRFLGSGKICSDRQRTGGACSRHISDGADTKWICYERRADPREGNIVGGRSINLAISTRGIHALEQIGIADEALQHAIPMRGRMIHDRSGELHFSPHDVDPKNVSIQSGAARSTQLLSKQHSAISKCARLLQSQMH